MDGNLPVAYSQLMAGGCSSLAHQAGVFAWSRCFGLSGHLCSKPTKEHTNFGGTQHEYKIVVTASGEIRIMSLHAVGKICVQLER
jgi:hypothetical protein